jgi:hypothetical protein
VELYNSSHSTNNNNSSSPRTKPEGGEKRREGRDKMNINEKLTPVSKPLLEFNSPRNCKTFEHKLKNKTRHLVLTQPSTPLATFVLK